jgi:Mce-associated membrane protein
VSQRETLLDSASEEDEDSPEREPSELESASSKPARQVRRGAVGAAVLAVVALGATAGVLLHQHRTFESAHDLEQRYLQTARQSVLDLTTISAATVDDDVARVLERSTGTFRDQFAERSDDFVSVVEQADVRATGSITEAGIENSDDSAASVLVAATSSVTNSSGAQEEPRVWRLRITLDNEDGTILVSDVEFVP